MHRRHLKLGVWLAILVACLAGGGYYVWKNRPLSPEEEAADREAARREWLELVERKGKNSQKSWAHAKVLQRCFKEGEPADEKILATATWTQKSYDGGVEHVWFFTVEKPRHPDETGFVFTAVAVGSPPRIQRIWGSLTTD